MNYLDHIYTDNIEEYSIKYFEYLNQVLLSIDTSSISSFVHTLLAARERGSTVFFVGNGGSASTASHFANDLSIGTYSPDKPFRVTSLNDNIPVITAISNDFGYEDVFLRQLQVLSNPNDVLVAISASGNSSNLLKAVSYANSNSVETVGITSFDGGELKSLVNLSVHVPTNLKEYGPAEDAHMILDHLIGSYLMRFVNRSM